MNITNKDSLLNQIAKGLVTLGTKNSIENIKVTFVTHDGEYDFGLPHSLDVLANDLYWDDRGNWADAYLARVEVF